MRIAVVDVVVVDDGDAVDAALFLLFANTILADNRRSHALVTHFRVSAHTTTKWFYEEGGIQKAPVVQGFLRAHTRTLSSDSNCYNNNYYYFFFFFYYYYYENNSNKTMISILPLINLAMFFVVRGIGFNLLLLLQFPFIPLVTTPQSSAFSCARP